MFIALNSATDVIVKSKPERPLQSVHTSTEVKQVELIITNVGIKCSVCANIENQIPFPKDLKVQYKNALEHLTLNRIDEAESAFLKILSDVTGV